MPRTMRPARNSLGEWDYSADQRFPVQDGEVWQAGAHLFGCGDLEQGDLSRLFAFAGIQRVEMMYFDPPYNTAAANAFRTKAQPFRGGRLGDPKEKVDFAVFLTNVFEEIKRHCTRDVYFEMGNSQMDLVQARLNAAGGRALNRWPIVYYKKHPAALWRVTFGSTVRELEPQVFTGMNDADTPKRAIEISSREGEAVCDLCFGRGLTARVADDLNRNFIGMELHPKRMAGALLHMADRGLWPRKVGSIR